MNKARALPKLDFNVTNRCNLRCVHCCFRAGQIMLEEFDLDQIRKTLAEFVALGGQRIDITGGEPLMRDDLEAIVQIAVQEFGLKTELVTNSMLLNFEQIDRLIGIGLSEIAISLDGATIKTHEQIRHILPSEFYGILDSIERCARLGLKTKVNTVVFSSNFGELTDITRLAIDVGASEHGFYFFSPIGSGTGRDQLVADPVQWLGLIRRELVELDQQIKISVEVPMVETELAEKLEGYCYLESPWHLQLLPDGNVFPCAIMAAYGHLIGNVNTQSLESIWQAQELWDETYFRTHVLPRIKADGCCVDYSAYTDLFKSDKYRFICLCKKFRPQELVL